VKRKALPNKDDPKKLATNLPEKPKLKKIKFTETKVELSLFEKLPIELHYSIFGFLGRKDHSVLSQTSHTCDHSVKAFYRSQIKQSLNKHKPTVPQLLNRIDNIIEDTANLLIAELYTRLLGGSVIFSPTLGKFYAFHSYDDLSDNGVRENKIYYKRVIDRIAEKAPLLSVCKKILDLDRDILEYRGPLGQSLYHYLLASLDPQVVRKIFNNGADLWDKDEDNDSLFSLIWGLGFVAKNGKVEWLPSIELLEIIIPIINQKSSEGNYREIKKSIRHLINIFRDSGDERCLEILAFLKTNIVILSHREVVNEKRNGLVFKINEALLIEPMLQKIEKEQADLIGATKLYQEYVAQFSKTVMKDEMNLTYHLDERSSIEKSTAATLDLSEKLPEELRSFEKLPHQFHCHIFSFLDRQSHSVLRRISQSCKTSLEAFYINQVKQSLYRNKLTPPQLLNCIDHTRDMANLLVAEIHTTLIDNSFIFSPTLGEFFSFDNDSHLSKEKIYYKRVIDRIAEKVSLPAVCEIILGLEIETLNESGPSGQSLYHYLVSSLNPQVIRMMADDETIDWSYQDTKGNSLLSLLLGLCFVTENGKVEWLPSIELLAEMIPILNDNKRLGRITKEIQHLLDVFKGSGDKRCLEIMAFFKARTSLFSNEVRGGINLGDIVDFILQDLENKHLHLGGAIKHYQKYVTRFNQTLVDEEKSIPQSIVGGAY
jgi:hypothetical protein